MLKPSPDQSSPEDVQEDLPGVGCAVTFFLCAAAEGGEPWDLGGCLGPMIITIPAPWSIWVCILTICGSLCSLYLGKFHRDLNQRPKPRPMMVNVRGIIQFYGRTIQVSEVF